MEHAVDLALAIGGRLAAAALALVAGYALAVAVRRLARRLLGRPRIAYALGPSMVRLFGSAAYWLVLAMTAAAGLVALGVPATFVATVAVVVIALVGVALQQSLANFAATVIFLLFQPFRRGELVETMGRLGWVQEILLFNTVLLLPDQRLVSLPNGKVQESGVVNYTRMGRIRADIRLTTAYGEDPDRVRAEIAALAASDARVLADPPLEVIVDDFDENGVRLLVLATVGPEHYLAVRNDLRERIVARFHAAGIAFAVPPREVRIAETTAARGPVAAAMHGEPIVHEVAPRRRPPAARADPAGRARPVATNEGGGR